MNLDQAYERAGQHHQAGQLAEAEQIYRKIIQAQPNHADALHRLGMIAHQGGKDDVAITLIGRAIELRPNVAGYYVNLGVALYAKNRLEEADKALRQALKLRADLPEALSILSEVSRKRGELNAAVETATRALALRPVYPEATLHLGNALREQGKLDEAAAALQRGITATPSSPVLHYNLGWVLQSKGAYAEARAAYRQAVDLDPNYVDANNALGEIAQLAGQLNEAEKMYRLALGLNPNYPLGWRNLAGALSERGRWAQAIEAFRKSLELEPDFVMAINGLGVALHMLGRVDEAMQCYEQTLRLEENNVEATTNLGNALKDSGRIEEAMELFDKALLTAPDFQPAHDNKVYTIQYHPAFDAERIRSELSQWNDRHAKPLSGLIQPHVNARDAERRLRVGYVSSDFRDHVVGRMMLPLIRHRDRQQFEVFCYSNNFQEDDFTRMFQSEADGFLTIAHRTDDAMAEQIRSDGIDILVDAAGHMRGSRLMIFARKPAPVQVMFLSYPGSTGMEAMDYRITDPYLDPPGETDGFYAEKSVRLLDSFWCYDPESMQAPREPVNPLPAIERGHITFGCLNNMTKVNQGVLETWARIMQATPGSHLLMLAFGNAARQRVIEIMGKAGIDSSRLEFVSYQRRREYLKTYERIDLALDTFPYNGHVTSLDAMWMGVPVVTLVGQTVVGRAGWSQLNNLHLTELVAKTPDEFVSIATNLAGDRDHLSTLRHTLRDRMLQSPLCDTSRFVANLESVYRTMWREFVESSRGHG
ncbi:MAG: tetratricopeptide repeat protein [Tepidisphaeraceae bacterium]